MITVSSTGTVLPFPDEVPEGWDGFPFKVLLVWDNGSTRRFFRGSFKSALEFGSSFSATAGKEFLGAIVSWSESGEVKSVVVGRES